MTIALLVFLMGLSGCLARTAPSQGSKGLDVITALRDRLSAARGLKFVEEVPILTVTKEVAKTYISSGQEQDVGGKKLEEVSLAYAKLGLLPLGRRSKANLLNLYSSQALAFYDSRAKKVIFIGNPDGRSGAWNSTEGAEKIIAHELAHALQDQRFSLGERLRSITNSDAALALRSIAEGDAVVTEYAYSFGGLKDWLPGYIRQVIDGSAEGSGSPNIPEMVVDKITFQYSAGTQFVLRILAKGGWPAVNLLYKHPPLSTEQVLHPQKYLEAPDPPVRIQLKDLSSLFSPEWREIENDTLGELMVRCLFKQFVGPEDAAMVGNGWGGDRFVVYQKGEEVAFIWATVWDAAKNADEFYDGYRKISSMKSGPPSAATRVYIEKRDRVVLIIDGLDRDRVKENIETVWNKMSLEAETFQPPPLASRISAR